MVIPRFVERAVAGAPLEVHGDGMQTRSFCHVSDTVRATVELMDARDISGEIFNVGSSESRAHPRSRAARARAHRVAVRADVRAALGGLRPRIEDVLHREPSIEKIRAAIGWRPSLDLDRILDDVIDHTRRAPAAELA